MIAPCQTRQKNAPTLTVGTPKVQPYQPLALIFIRQQAWP
jgi:hypothetical protein